MRIQYYGTGDGYGIPEPFCSCRLCSYAREHGGKDVRTRSQAVIDDLMIDCSVDLLAHTLFYGLDMRKYPNILITPTMHTAAAIKNTGFIRCEKTSFSERAPVYNASSRSTRADAPVVIEQDNMV